jgi:hypothetical protein
MVVDTTAGSDHDFYKYPVLEITGTVPEVSGEKTFQFVFAGNVEITGAVTANGVLQGILNSATASALLEVAEVRDNEGISRRTAFIDVGSGEHTMSINFLGWDNADTDLGTSTFYWGAKTGADTSDGNYTQASAKEQIQFLNRIVGGTLTSSIGFDESFGPAKFFYGDYAPDNAGPNNEQGKYQEDFLPVAVSSSSGTRTSEQGDSFTGSLELTAIRSLQRDLDSLTETIV